MNNSSISILSNAHINIIKILNNYINEDFRIDSSLIKDKSFSIEEYEKKRTRLYKSNKLSKKVIKNIIQISKILNKIAIIIILLIQSNQMIHLINYLIIKIHHLKTKSLT